MKRFQKMKRVISLLMACLLVFGLSTTALASNSPVVDNSVPMVNVFFQGNNPYASVCRIDANGVEDEYFGSIGEMVQVGSSFGTIVCDIKVVNSDPEAEFLGWMVCYPVLELDEDGNPVVDEFGWTKIHHWELFDETMYTTAEALAYTVPLNYEYEYMAFMAQWSGSGLPDSGGETEEGKVQIDVFANGGTIKFTGSYMTGTETSGFGNQYEIGSTLRENGIEFEDTTWNGKTVTGWKAFVPGEISPNMTPIENIPLLTTKQLLDFELPDYPIFFIAQYSNGTGGNSGNQGGSDAEPDVPGDTLNFFLYGGGGLFDYKYVADDEMKNAKGAGLFVYDIDNDKAFKQCMDERGDGLVNIYKQCATLKGWELYTCDHVEFFNVPAGQDPAIGDEDMILLYLMENGGRDYYALMINSVKADSLKTTDEIYNLTGGKDYFATLVWDEAHAEGDIVVENKVEPTTEKEGSYESVVYCADCKVEISRTKHTIDKIVKPGKVTDAQINQTTTKVENIIAGSESVTVKKDIIANTMNKEVIKEAMVSKPEFKESMKKFEEAYVKDQNVTVEKTAVDDAVKAVVNKDSIAVVGAGLNGTKDSTVKLNVAKVNKPVKVSNNYANAVQVDIKLLVNNQSKEVLDIPVVITMDIPTGVSGANLVILHYHAGSETPEVIKPEVNDGKITFAVDKFSTFVFANEEAGTAPTPTEWDAYQELLNGMLGNTVVESPKTGDSNMAFVVALFAVVTAGAVVYRRKTVN